MAELKFIPYEHKLKQISNLYYIEITVIGKNYYIVSYTNDLEDNVMLIYPKSVYTLDEALKDFNDHIKEFYNNRETI
jgi:hypothetical protein